MTIPALPQLDRTSPTFRSDLDAFFLTQLPDTVTALNAELTRIDGITPAGFTGTSTTSLTIASSGSITLTVQSNKGFAAGQLVLIAVTADPATQMQGIVTSYNATTGELVLARTASTGSGTYSAWTVSMTVESVSAFSAGDIALTNRALTSPTWLPADGSIYSQSSYASLYTEVGLIKDGLSKPFSTAGLTTQNVINTSLPYLPQGIPAWPLISFGSYALLYTKGTGVATNKFARTTDGGLTWVDVTLPNPATDVSYLRVASHDGGTTLVAIHGSTDAWVARSSDSGVTWTTRSVVGYSEGTQLFVLNGVYVIMKSSGTSAWISTDGITWIGRTLPVAALTCWAVVTYQGAQRLIASTSTFPTTTIYTSTDAITWTARTVPSMSSNYFAYGTSPVSHNDVIIWLGAHYEYGAYKRSTDGGATWTSHTLPQIGYSLNYIYSPTRVFDGRFICILYQNGGGALMSSTDGLTWETEPTPFSDDSEASKTIYHTVVNGILYIQEATTSTMYSRASMTAQWTPSYFYSPSAAFAQWMLPALCETANTQLTLTGAYAAIAGAPKRRPLYTYNTSTQFAVPNVRAPAGVTAYIKA